MSNFGNVCYAVLIFSTLSYNIEAIFSPVECPGKDVNEIRQQAEQFEVSFLYYHVSWSNESQTSRLVYEEVARDYREIYFGFIDCYHLACNCSKTHPLSLGTGSPNRWPTLVIRYGHRVDLHYNGEWSVSALNRFIEALYMPVERLHTRDELKKLSMHRDAVVLGIFDNESQLEYRRFVSASVKWLEIDPEYSFRFATAIGSSVENVLGSKNNTNRPIAQLLLITSKGIDVMRAEWHVSNIVLWLQTEFVRSLSILYGYNSPKSLAVHLQLSPVLAIIANDYFYEYMYNLTSPGITYNLLDPAKIWHRELVELQEVEYVKYTLKKKQLLNPLKCFSKEFLTLLNLRYYYALNKYLTHLICDVSPSCTNKKTSIDNLYITCSRKTHISSPTSKISAAKYLKKFVESNWEEYKSQQNQSLAVVILDGAKYLDFLQTLGISHVEASNFVTLIIADRLKESIFVSQDLFTYDRLQKFIRSYYNNSLLAYKTNSNVKINPLSQNKLFLENVNSEMFLKKIEQTDLTTIMLLHSPQCMFSAFASQALIQLTAMLDDMSGIQVIRLNTLFDELPWEFKMANTPTLLVFPRGRATDSRAYPMHIKLDVRNIFTFVLAQMEPVDKLKALLSCCRRRRLHSHRMRKCLQYVKTLAAKYISDNKTMQRFIDNQTMQAKITELNDIIMELTTIFPFY